MGNAIPYLMVFWSLLSSKLLLGNPGRWKSNKSSRDKCWPAQARPRAWLAGFGCDANENGHNEKESKTAQSAKPESEQSSCEEKLFLLVAISNPVDHIIWIDSQWKLLRTILVKMFKGVRVRSFDWIKIQCTFFFCEATTTFGRWQEQAQCPSEIWSRAF